MKKEYISPSLTTIDFPAIMQIQVTSNSDGYGKPQAKESNTLNWDDEQSDDEQY